MSTDYGGNKMQNVSEDLRLPGQWGSEDNAASVHSDGEEEVERLV